MIVREPAVGGLGVVASYLFSSYDLDLSITQARTVATSVLILVGLYLILVLEASGRTRSVAVSTLCASLLAAYGVVLAVPFGRDFFELALPGPAGWLIVVAGAALAVLGLRLVSDRFVPGGEAGRSGTAA